MNYVMTEKTIEKPDMVNISQIVKTYGSKLLSFINSKVKKLEDAEDILQDVWYQFLGLSSDEELDSISGWLYFVTKNKINDFYRKKRPVLLEDISYSYDTDENSLLDILLRDDSGSPEYEIQKEIFWKEFNKALQSLPDNQKTTFILNEFKGMTLQEIADAQEENLKTVISRKRYALKNLRSKLEHLFEEF